MTTGETARILALLRGEQVGEVCPDPKCFDSGSNFSERLYRVKCRTCNGTGRINTEPSGPIEEAVVDLRRKYDALRAGTT